MTRGVVFAEPGAAPAVEEITVEAPGAGEVLVRVEACGVCHTDLHVVESGGWGMRFPILLGHEGAGTVEAVGDGVASVEPGDRVVIAWRAPCGDACRACRRGDLRRCSNNLRTRSRMFRADGARLSPVLRSGAYADRVVVHESAAVPVPDALPLEQACLLACGFSTGAGAALWTTPVQPGSSVAVIGCGGVGLAVVQGARLAGAETIVAVDVVPEKLELALELGATHAVDASAGDAVARVREVTDGVDYAFSAITSTSGLVDAVRMCAYAGTATLVGVPPSNRTLDVDVEQDLFGPKVSIAVTHGGDTIPQQDFPFLAQAALDGRVDLAKFVTRTISLDEVPQALEALHTPTGVRTVVLF